VFRLPTAKNRTITLLSSVQQAAKLHIGVFPSSSEQINKMEIQYNSKDKLGEGGFGSVFFGRFNGHQVAVKRVDVTKVNDNEEKVLKQLDHPNIIKLFHSEIDADEHFK
jgi:serine/threonine protein kinase